ncbi:putative inner membrane protein [Mycobacteroides abscessus subsp. abscessus]|nr:putative inner membrane protein [Mycobacteroides abscessus subsp. abscessus]
MNATDVTASLGAPTEQVTKMLNLKDSGDSYLPGLPPRSRTIFYLPSARVSDGVIANLRPQPAGSTSRMWESFCTRHRGRCYATPRHCARTTKSWIRPCGSMSTRSQALSCYGRSDDAVIGLRPSAVCLERDAEVRAVYAA